ncbi:hypothetical protein HN460_00655 [bacterium]|nr:hypothetical protein [bacterium]MBT3795403.1 hypothetical protein [bacterium]MBT4634024.1 hypothetical protein [bacterium]
MKEVHLSFQEDKLKIETDCADEIINKIEEYININYLKHNLSDSLIPRQTVSNILLVNAVYEILSLEKEKEESGERINKVLSSFR